MSTLFDASKVTNKSNDACLRFLAGVFDELSDSLTNNFSHR